MPFLHDEHAAMRRRLESLTASSPRVWGKMSADQMLWHVSQAMEMAIGTYTSDAKGPPMPKWMMRLILLKLPWPRGAPTGPDFVAKREYDFGEQKARLLRLLGEFVARPIEGSWPTNPVIGAMTGREWSHLMHKHLDHHLRQFSA